jgi:hypothetical protein
MCLGTEPRISIPARDIFRAAQRGLTDDRIRSHPEPFKKPLAKPGASTDAKDL